MPSGKTHTRFELVLGPGFVGGFYYFFRPTWAELVLFALAYVAASLWLSPDLDLKANSARRRWGPLGFIWGPYTRMFKHRGMSHSLVVGPLTRLIYLAMIVSLVLVGLSYVGLALPREAPIQLEERTFIVLGAGLYLPNVLHVLLDRIVSAFR